MSEDQENTILKQIIEDLLKFTDGCGCCEAKGQRGPACECMNDTECVNHIIELYRREK